MRILAKKVKVNDIELIVPLKTKWVVVVPVNNKYFFGTIDRKERPEVIIDDNYNQEWDCPVIYPNSYVELESELWEDCVWYVGD